MSIALSLHNVKSLELRPPQQLMSSCWTRKIVLTSDSGCEDEITFFADTREQLLSPAEREAAHE